MGNEMSGTQILPPEAIQLPLLPLRDVVVFPHMVIPLFVGRPKSIKALETAMEGGKHIMLVAQKAAAKDEPTSKDLYEIGCVANILQMLKLPDGTVKVVAWNKAITDEQMAKINDVEAQLESGRMHVFAGPLRDQSGKERAHAGTNLPDPEIFGMNWLVEGLDGSLPN